jgi:hypothetical protein
MELHMQLKMLKIRRRSRREFDLNPMDFESENMQNFQ